jgi:transcriptional regulator with XRE-family HTH domain
LLSNYWIQMYLLVPLPQALSDVYLSNSCRIFAKTLSVKHKSCYSDMSIEKRIAQLREEKNWSQSELEDKSGVSRVMIGKYERGEASPSVDAAKRIADAFGVSLDYLAGQGTLGQVDKKTLKRLQEIELLKDEERKILTAMIDAFLRDAHTRKAYQ